jgi:2-iminobutanoate/2-iminopropanoate deaminase
MKKPLISRAAKVGNLLFLSGMVGQGDDTGAQARDIFEKIRKILEEAGSSLDKIVNATVYLTDINDREKYFNNIWSEFFPVNPPTRTCIQVGLTPPMKVEVTVIALVPEKIY